MAQNPNLLFICVDCLRQDQFVKVGDNQDGFMNEILSQGVNYSEMYSTTTTTTPSVASIFSGAYSEKNGVNSLRNCSLNDDVSMLAELLSGDGFETAAMVTGPLSRETGLQRGFDHYWYREPDQNLVGSWSKDALEKLDSLSEPYFAYLHLWELHKPINVPEEYDEKSYGDYKYEKMSYALDESLNSFINDISQEVTIILHGDHGESFSGRGSAFHYYLNRARALGRYKLGIDTRVIEQLINRLLSNNDSPKDHYIEMAHGTTIHDFMTNVPFVISTPKLNQEKIDKQCRQVDILPTILDLFSISTPDNIDGLSLLPPENIDDRIAYSRACGARLLDKKNWQKGIRSDGYKYITYPDRDWGPELYDLESDPQELQNIAASNPEKINDLNSKMPRESLSESEDIDIEDRLSDLGYI